MNRSSHIVEKVFLEVNTSKLETAHAIKDNIGEFLRNELFPRLEVLFDEFNLNETVLRFDEINLDFSINEKLGLNEIKHEINVQLADQLQQHIQSFVGSSHLPNETNGSHADEPKGQKIPFSANQEAVFFFFLEQGFLPWFGNESHISGITEKENWERCIENSAFVEKLKALLVREKLAVERFLYQFSEETIVAFLAKINPKIKEQHSTVLQLLAQNEPAMNQQVLLLLLHHSLSLETKASLNALHYFFRQIKISEGFGREYFGPKTIAETENLLIIVKLLRDILPEAVVYDSRLEEVLEMLGRRNPKSEDVIVDISAIAPKDESQMLLQKELVTESQSPQQENQTPQQELQTSFFEKGNDEIAIQNAGLILLHPFLKHFLVKIEVADKHGNLLREKLDLAVQSLHFLATGNENVFEGNLVFEKFLCGLPLKMPVEKQSLLDDTIRNEAEVLLKEAITNWKALKNSSPNDLRQLFIQREGKLIQKENQYKLVVERKAQDALLERISWNISMLKLPWRKELIVVEW